MWSAEGLITMQRVTLEWYANRSKPTLAETPFGARKSWKLIWLGLAREQVAKMNAQAEDEGKVAKRQIGCATAALRATTEEPAGSSGAWRSSVCKRSNTVTATNM